MANEEHLNIFTEGPDAWDAWRQANPSVIPDLSGADFSGMGLSVA